MSKLQWDKVGERFYKTGVDHGVLYPSVNGTYPKGVAWSGLTAVNESPSGAEANPFYADNIKYFNLFSAEDFSATIEAYYYPQEWEECDGSAEIAPGVLIGQQNRKAFGFCYRTLLGNDTEGQAYGYELHLIYNAMASPSERSNSTVNDSPEPATMSWEVTTTPVDVPGFKPTAHLTISSVRTDPRKMKIIEGILYGSDKTEARLPLPEEIMSIMTSPLPTEAVVTATAATTQRYKKNASDLQDNIVVGKSAITGTLKYVTEYNLGDSIPTEGHYLALDITATNGGKITTEMTNRKAGTKIIPVDDGYCVYFVEGNNQKLRITVTKEDYTDTTEYDLSGLTLSPKA